MDTNSAILIARFASEVTAAIFRARAAGVPDETTTAVLEQAKQAALAQSDALYAQIRARADQQLQQKD